MESLPLVSVAIISYNSEATIIDTLNSIKEQTYSRIELVISDDGSSDNTVKICKDWLSDNSKRFVGSKVLESPINTGIPSNYNRVEKACTGDWIKNINADDYLLPDCIKTFAEYVLEHPEASYVFCKIKVVGGSKAEIENCERIFDFRNDNLAALNVEKQYELICKGEVPPAPGSFYNKKIAKVLGIVADERIKSFEDWPRWIDALKQGVKFNFIDKRLVVFRLGGISTTSKWQSVEAYKSRRQTFLYHIFEDNYKKDPVQAIESLLDYECDCYKRYLFLLRFSERVKNNIIYRCARTIKRTILKYEKHYESDQVKN